MSFEACFKRFPSEEPVVAYLILLDLKSRKAAKGVLRLIQSDAKIDPRATVEAIRLIRFPNWRENLVGAVASLFLPPAVELISALWNRVQQGTWVSPQMIVVLERIDPEFELHAMAESNSLCRGGVKRSGKVTPESHSAMGPESPEEAGEKAIGAIEAILKVRAGGTATSSRPPGPVPPADAGRAIALNWRKELLDVLDGLEKAP